jgi:type VI secretion system protein ImpM
MRCALFGKVPSKRDFIAPQAPRKFLDVWEPWIQGGISASRQSLGDHWQAAYLKAPIWRFWLGAELCGTTVVGAFMPSLDGIGRYFPLTAFACADDGAAIPPPEFLMQDEWFAAVEDFLLTTLDHGITYEAIVAALDQLPLPADRLPGARPDGISVLPEGTVADVAEGQPFSDVFALMRVTDYARLYAAATFWWTIGGEGYRPFAIGGRRMPDPFLFTEMLTGRFAFGFD